MHCSLFLVVRCLLYGIGCFLRIFVVSSVSCVARCVLLFVVSWLLLVLRWSLCVVCCVLFVVSCLSLSVAC